jgi:EmrB/QacA subfamily drug resistance transporter
MADLSNKKRWTLFLCCLAQFMVILDVSIVNVALPSIRSDLKFSAADLQWVVNAYVLMFAGVLLLGGRAADLLGRRRVFVAGLGLFGVASLVGGLAPSQGVLVAARGIQGLGGALVAPATLAIISTTFAEGAERNRALGAWGAMGGLGGATGALLGGVLTQELDWRWILLINIPVGAFAIWIAMRHVDAGRPDKAPERRHFDLSGAVTATFGLIVLVYGIVGTETHGWGSTRTLAILASGVVLLAAFIAIEARFAHAPLVPLRIFSSRQLTGANIVVFALGSAMFAMWYFVSLYMQEVLGYDPIKAGVAFVPMTLLIVVFSQVSGRLTARVGPGKMLTVGLGLIAAGMALFARVATDGGYFGDLLIPSVLTATGLGLSFVPVTIAAVTGVQPGEQGLASGLVNTSRQLGGSLGLAVLATLATQRTADLAGGGHDLSALTSGFHRAFIVGAGFALLGAIAAATLLQGARIPRREASAAAEAS